MDDMNNTKNMYLGLYEKFDNLDGRKIPTGEYGLGIFVKGETIPTPDQKDQLGNALNGIQLYSDFLGTQTVIGQMQWETLGARPANPNVVSNGIINAEYDQHYGLKQVSELIDRESLSTTDVVELLEGFVANDPDLKDEVVEQLTAQINEYRSANNMNKKYR